jgi:hypothetical protein
MGGNQSREKDYYTEKSPSLISKIQHTTSGIKHRMFKPKLFTSEISKKGQEELAESVEGLPEIWQTDQYNQTPDDDEKNFDEINQIMGGDDLIPSCGIIAIGVLLVILLVYYLVYYSGCSCNTCRNQYTKPRCSNTNYRV